MSSYEKEDKSLINLQYSGERFKEQYTSLVNYYKLEKDLEDRKDSSKILKI